VRAWRGHVDAALAEALPALDDATLRAGRARLQHEQQHQELLLTDILHLFAQNPLAPAYCAARARAPAAAAAPVRWIAGRSGIVEVGHDASGFGFDCEGPRHATLLHPHALADRTVTNANGPIHRDGGYARPEHWLADGWAWVRREGVVAPLYWRASDDGWAAFGLDGLQPLHPRRPSPIQLL
jgi:formylglycine-generating enzyme required for sulfatase activity